MIGIFLLSFLMVILDTTMTFVLEPIITGLVGDSGLFFSMIGSVVYIGNILFLYPLVKLSDRIGRKKTILISLGMTVIGTFFLYFASQYWMILLLRFIIGFNSLAGVISALTMDHFPEEERGKPLSMFSIGLVAGFLIGTLVGGPVYALFGPRNSFIVLAIFAFFGVLSAFIFIKDATKTEIREKQEEILNLPIKDTWEFLQHNNAIIGTLILNFIIMIIMSGSGTYGIFMVLNHFDLEPIIGGLYLLPIQLIQIFLFIILGRVKNFKKSYAILWGVIIIMMGFGISFFFWDNPIQFSVSICFFGAAMVIVMQSADSISHMLIPQVHKSNLVSIYRLVGIIGQIIGPALFGLLTDFIWVYSPGIFIIIASILMELIFWKWICKEQALKVENQI